MLCLSRSSLSLVPIVVYHICLCINTHLTDTNFTYQQIHHSSIIACHINNNFLTLHCQHHLWMFYTYDAVVYIGAWRCVWQRVAYVTCYCSTHVCDDVTNSATGKTLTSWPGERPIYTLKLQNSICDEQS